MPNLPRFLVSPDLIGTKKFSIQDENDVRKMRNVLRLEPKDLVRAFDGKGNEYTGKITKLTREFAVCDIVEKSELKINDSKAPKIIIAQALTRTTKIDQIIKMNSEIGVKDFIFFETDHSIVKIKDIKPNKFQRWGKIAKEAIRQSEQTTVPVIREIMNFEDLVKMDIKNKFLLETREESSISLKELNNLSTEEVLIIIGPEGGFSKKELDLARASEVQFVHLNLPILRTETAGLVFASYLMISSVE